MDEHVHHLDPFTLSKYISKRKSDFTSGIITDCYVVFCGRAVRVNAGFQTRREIESLLETLSLILSRLYATRDFVFKMAGIKNKWKAYIDETLVVKHEGRIGNP